MLHKRYLCSKNKWYLFSFVATVLPMRGGVRTLQLNRQKPSILDAI